METNATLVTPASVGLRFGLLLAVSVILVDFLIRIAGFSFIVFGVAAVLSSLAVSIICLVFAHRAFKQANDNLMSFGQGMIIAVIMLLISGLAAGIFNYVYLHYIDAEFVDRMKAGMTELMERNNIPSDQIEKSTARFDAMKTDFGKALLGGLSNGLGSGLILGAIVSAFTKRKQPEFE